MEAASNFLYEKFGERATKIAFVTFCLFTGSIAICLSSGLIYYERQVRYNQHSSTLINRIYVLYLSYIIIMSLGGNAVVITRTLYGPLPKVLCHCYNGLICGVAVAVCLAFNESIVVKFIYCCVLKSIGCLNEPFWSAFLAILNVALAIYTAAFLYYGNMSTPGPFLYCSGCSPEASMRPRLYDNDVPFACYIIWLTLLCHVVLQYKIQVVKCNLDSLWQPKKSFLTSWIHLFVLAFVGFGISLAVVKNFNHVLSGNTLDMSRPLMNVVLGWGVPGYSYMRMFYRNKVFCCYL